MKFPRASGVLLHPTSLPNEYGIGDFGKSAYEFVDFLEEARQTYWQVLPLGPTGFGDSPYQSFSAFAGNTNLISPETLARENLLSQTDLDERPDFESGNIDFGKVIDWKKESLAKAYENFCKTDDLELRGSFETFTGQVSIWLDDYALFRSIKATQGQKLWLKWDEPLRMRDESALFEARKNLSEEIRAQKFYQFLFFKQWGRLKNYANGKGIKIIGDMPIFLSLDSADVWCDPQEFKLNEDLTPSVVAGVPPDYFSKTGQLWGNPIYDWGKMQADGFGWWKSRVGFALKTVDILRIDHFRGFAGSWEVPGGDKTAENGNWVSVPGKELFETLVEDLGELPVMAEDLGVMTDDVKALRDGFEFPGMKILQYGLGGDSKNNDLPHNYVRNCVAYTGTHDNDTTVGWFRALKAKKAGDDEKKTNAELDFCLDYLNTEADEIHWDLIRAVWGSVADTAIVPMQDLLGLGNKARMNVPASKSNNWQWRCEKGSYSDQIAERLRKLTENFGRKPR